MFTRACVSNLTLVFTHVKIGHTCSRMQKPDTCVHTCKNRTHMSTCVKIRLCVHTCKIGHTCSCVLAHVKLDTRVKTGHTRLIAARQNRHVCQVWHTCLIWHVCDFRHTCEIAQCQIGHTCKFFGTRVRDFECVSEITCVPSLTHVSDFTRVPNSTHVPEITRGQHF